ncbi:MAG: exopolysaccharide biosynthesis polyprenyl glycosylphosphotransferase [Terricaulis sp.]
MSKPAFAQAWPDLAHDVGERAALKREAQRLAELAGAFSLFGLRIDIDVTRAPFMDAEAFCRTDASIPAPANDRFASPQFPSIHRRGVHIDPRLPVWLIQALDWVFVIVAAECAARWGAGAPLAHLTLGQAAGYIAAAAALKIGLWLTESYRRLDAREEHELGGLALGAILGVLIANALAFDARGAAALAAVLPLAALLLAGVHAAYRVWAKAAHRAGIFSENIVIVGATDAARRLALRIAQVDEARVLAIVDDRRSRSPTIMANVPVAGDVDALLAWNDLPYIDRIIVAVPSKAEARVRAILQKLRTLPNRVDLLLDYEVGSVRGRQFGRTGGTSIAIVSAPPPSGVRALLKRASDVFLGSLLLLLFALPMGAIAVAVKLDSKGPALYRQRRHGFNNRVITVLKFRTMRHAPDAPLRQVVPGDERITRSGGFLRRTSLDELPQLINVLVGDMSLVGPRPHAVGMKAAGRELGDIVAEYAHRHRVKPGITGLAQVHGSRGPLHTPACVRRRLRLDLDYVARASLWLDLQILARTAPVLLGDRKATR